MKAYDYVIRSLKVFLEIVFRFWNYGLRQEAVSELFSVSYVMVSYFFIQEYGGAQDKCDADGYTHVSFP